jgi:hypothetical protein
MAGIFERDPHLADATRERILRDDHVGPDLGQQLVLGHEAARMGGQIMQQREALGTQ